MLVNFNAENAVVSAPAEKKEMLSVKKLGDKTKVRINSSSLTIIQECPRKARYLLSEEWRAENESPATLFGSAIHKALEVYYSTPLKDRSRIPKLDELELMSFGHAHRDEENPLVKSIRAFLVKAEPLGKLPPEDKRSLQNGTWILWNYFKSYVDDPYVTYYDDSGPFVERDFSFTLYEDDKLEIEYFGRIDLVLRNSGTGNLLVCDHKTSSIVGNDFYNRLKPNHQYTGYLLGTKKCYALDTDSFLVNCLQVKARPRTKYGQAPHFPRQITVRSEDDYAEFRETVRDSVRNYLYFSENGIWPMGSTSICANYGGCMFLQVCAAPETLRENILKSKFKGSI